MKWGRMTKARVPQIRRLRNLMRDGCLLLRRHVIKTTTLLTRANQLPPSQVLQDTESRKKNGTTI